MAAPARTASCSYPISFPLPSSLSHFLPVFPPKGVTRATAMGRPLDRRLHNVQPHALCSAAAGNVAPSSRATSRNLAVANVVSTKGLSVGRDNLWQEFQAPGESLISSERPCHPGTTVCHPRSNCPMLGFATKNHTMTPISTLEKQITSASSNALCNMLA